MNDEMIGKIFGRWTVLELAPKVGRRLYYKCQCGCNKQTVRNVRKDLLKNGSSQSCGCLQREATRKRYNEIREDLSGQKFGRLTVIREYGYKDDGKGMYWECTCDCNLDKILVVLQGHLKTGNTKSCGCLNKERVAEAAKLRIDDLTGQKFGKLTVLHITDEKVGCNYKWHCKCDCGNYTDVVGYRLSHGITKSCGKCDFTSYGEWKIRCLLEENNIKFEQEKTFDGCINENTGQKYRFDFYVNDSYIIEFDGLQHFIEAGDTWERNNPLEERQMRDIQKVKWCVKNNIPIIHIPYYNVDNITIESLLLDTADFVIAGEMAMKAYLLPLEHPYKYNQKISKDRCKL